MLAQLDPTPFPPAFRTVHELVAAGIGMRRLRTKEARAALARADHAARHRRGRGMSDDNPPVSQTLGVSRCSRWRRR